MTSERGNTGRRRSAASFAVSACFHGGILGFVAGLPPQERPQSIYDREIRSSEKKIVWYNLREKLPEVAPAIVAAAPKPPRARVKFDQTLVSGIRDDDRPPQMIFTPAPEVVPTPKLPKPTPLPNVVAIAPPPKPVREFVAPPVERRPDEPAPALPEAPRATASADARNLALPLAGPKPQPLAFSAPPEVRLQRQAALLLPDAPAVSAAAEVHGELPIAAPTLRPGPKTFTAPAQPLTGPVGLRAAASLAEAPDAAEAGASSRASQATMAIVGLHPVDTTLAPAPPVSRQAGFSAGPVEHPDTGAATSDARIAVPGLLVRGGVKDDRPSLATSFSPTSRENLLAAAHITPGSSGPPVASKTSAEEPRAIRVASSPGARLSGRLVYTVAIQMPNVTSYSGSWIVWFALREAGASGPLPDVRPPVPVRKVDPKYIQSAVADRVEGKVLLSGVIRADGHVESVAVVSGLDQRLDGSAAEALAKWIFEPAARNGSPVVVDAIFEIPFRLAPKTAK